MMVDARRVIYLRKRVVTVAPALSVLGGDSLERGAGNDTDLGASVQSSVYRDESKFHILRMLLQLRDSKTWGCPRGRRATASAD